MIDYIWAVFVALILAAEAHLLGLTDPTLIGPVQIGVMLWILKPRNDT